uniref:Uncharacterized protein n=1 Tax=Candidatus Kentrum sp. FM TaxID=2126340 RepID=A0A450SIX5_9GAMM|nr:MAG: hypothetical protein BECKFM1743A_GA0114220_101143 [Candidatus Kentron sp. FM]VFJ54582.1 MAG: hypothetical protein BECKFM1743C_GA0114222_101413 [Candidatus Kentron sp. FM]VFK10368.1 MAG: hypothetical protein BECKFM1743B_GA0114221_101383 [Candidatus Kentron sp. FM]
MNDINAVAMMRRIRDDLSRKMEGMTWEEEREYIRNSIKSFDFITKRGNGTPLGNPGKGISCTDETRRREPVHS